MAGSTDRTIGSLFSGIGGLELGLERSGLGQVAWQCEIDPFCVRVLERHWPNATRFGDVRKAHEFPSVDALCGGFPCQPVSVAGKRLAQEDPRWLWPHFRQAIETSRPGLIVIENVPGLRSAGLRGVLEDLAALGFDAEWSTLSACQFGAPHRRTRIFIVAAHPDRVSVRQQPGWLGRTCRSQAPQPRLDVADAVREGRGPGRADVESSAVAQFPIADAESCGRGGVSGADGAPSDHRSPTSNPDGVRRLEQAISVAEERGWPGHCGWRFDPWDPIGAAPRVDDGISPRLGGNRRGRRRVKLHLGAKRKALGNAVVVACAEFVGRAILSALEPA